MTNKSWCEYCYLKDEKPCYECNACFKGSNFRAIKTIKPTNYERIKNMSVEELANFILTISDDEEIFCKIINGEEIYGSVCEVMQWLESEAKDNG
jgi:hypothetical protein